MSASGQPQEPEPVYRTVQVAAVVKVFAAQWRKTRPSSRGRFSSDERGPNSVQPLGPYEALSFWTGLPQADIESVANCRAKTSVTSLGVVDALVAAIDCPEAWHDGRLTAVTGVYRNE